MSGKVDGVRGVSLTVHTDLTSIEADTLFEELVPQLPKECRHGRYMLINVWRSIGDEPVEDDHLALLDERTTAKPDDYVQTEYWSTEPTCPQMVQYILSTRNAPAHRWYYVPRMTRSEVLVFKSFDSKPTCPARLCFHTAVKDPTAREGCPTRQSIDVRALVCFPAHEPDSCPPLKARRTRAGAATRSAGGPAALPSAMRPVSQSAPHRSARLRAHRSMWRRAVSSVILRSAPSCARRCTATMVTARNARRSATLQGARRSVRRPARAGVLSRSAPGSVSQASVRNPSAASRAAASKHATSTTTSMPGRTGRQACTQSHRDLHLSTPTLSWHQA